MPSEFESSATSNNMSYTQKAIPRSGNKYTSTRLMKFRCVPGSKQGKIGGSCEDNGGGCPWTGRIVVHQSGSPGFTCTPEYDRVALLLVEVQHRSHVLKVATSPPLRVREWPLREKYDKGWKSTCKHTLLKDGLQATSNNKKVRRRSSMRLK